MVRLPAGRRIDALGSKRRLQALAAVGWPLPALAGILGRNSSNLRRTLTTACVTATTARAIDRLYTTLHDTAPPAHTAAQRTAAARTQVQARHAGWLPPQAWDDIDHELAADHHDNQSDYNDGWLDEIAVEQAMNGRRVSLTRAERDEAIARLTRQGSSARDIADRLGISSRNVVRRRTSHRNAA